MGGIFFEVPVKSMTIQKRYRGITTLLGRFPDPSLVNYFKSRTPEELKAVSDQAISVGKLLDDYSQDDSKELTHKQLSDYQVKNAVRAWDLWCKEHTPLLNDAQVKIECPELKMVGYRDFKINDNTILDVKCAGKISWEYWLQTEFYAYLENRYGAGGITKKAILRLDKDLGIYEYVEKELNPNDMTAIVCMLFINHERTHHGDNPTD